jgi:Family of unknown function (DUF6931)
MTNELPMRPSSSAVVQAAHASGLSNETLALIPAEPTVEAFLDVLFARELFVDASKFLAHVMPKREAVWWACLCVQQSQGISAAEANAINALEAARRWVVEPDEANRLAAGAAANATGIGLPAGCTAMAAFWSGGSLGSPEFPAIPPPDDLTPRGVSGAVILAVVGEKPELAPVRFRQFIALGLNVLNGINRWEEYGKPLELRTQAESHFVPPKTSESPAHRTIRISDRRV